MKRSDDLNARPSAAPAADRAVAARRPHAKAGCTCACHHTSIAIVCCSCSPKGCECAKPRTCCGDPEKPDDFGIPTPGWHPGDRPPPNPLLGATDLDDLDQKFRAAVIELQAGGRDGVKFGPRKTELLPYLVIRAAAGDRGARPIGGAFWESPDIFIAPNVSAPSAPAVPPTRAGTAQAGAPNTLWAHVWNLGLSDVVNARVEFYWFNPNLGFNAASANLIGVTHVDLGNRFSGQAHTIVKCPTTWVPTYLNGGHECLMVKVFDPFTDPLGPDSWNASTDRHVGQRNISVVDAHSPAALQLALRLGCSARPGPATIEVTTARVADVGWFAFAAQETQERARVYRDPDKVAEIVGLMPPAAPARSPQHIDLRNLSADAARGILHRRIEFERGCDELEALFYASVEGLERGEARTFRILQRLEGRVIGGYTVVMHGS